eukprot:10356326-Karenia_brevis.AAC.1
MAGDFWQLQPTGDTAIIANPENGNLGGAKLTTSIFWDCQSIDWGLNVGQIPRPSFMSFHGTFVQGKISGGMKYWNKHARESSQTT